MPPNDWTFQFAGFMNVTAQFGVEPPAEPGARTERHRVSRAAATPIDEYQSFVGTSTMPGNWIQMNFRYGNRDVIANLTLSTWNPSQPTTYYQLGSQGFVNNAFLTYNVPRRSASCGCARTSATSSTTTATSGQYTAGMYQMPYVGGARGVGERWWREYPLTPELSLYVEEGFMGNRNGRSPAGNAPANPNNNVDPCSPRRTSSTCTSASCARPSTR